MKYVVVYEKSATGWGAYVPDLPGVIATDRTKEETQRLIREAIKLHLDRLRVEGRQPTRQDSPRPITNTP